MSSVVRPLATCNQSIQKRLSRMRKIREKQSQAIQRVCGGKSKSFDVIPSKECIIMWAELDETIKIIHQLRDKIESEDLYWFEEEKRMYDV